MKLNLANLGYLYEATPQVSEVLQAKETVKGKSFDGFAFKSKNSKKVIFFCPDKIIIPRMLAYYLARKYEIPIDFKWYEGQDYEFISNIRLKEGQKDFVENVVSFLKTNYGAIGLGKCGCLAGDTKVYIKDEHLPITIKQLYQRTYESEILYYDGYGFKYYPVIRVFHRGVQKIFRLMLQNGYAIDGTYDHPILTTEGYLPLIVIPFVNSSVYIAEGKDVHLVKPISVQYIGEDEVYDISCESPHNFIANNIIVHNSGKTVCALEIASRLKKKFIVLVHTEFLAKQWEDRVREFLGCEVGRVHRDRCDIGKPVLIAMAHTVVKRNYHPQVFKDYGLLIVDEVHRFSCDMFSEAIVHFNTKYRLGLTATPDRSDGLTDVFKYHIGKIVDEIKTVRLEGVACFVKTTSYFGPSYYKTFDGKINLSRLITGLSRDEQRNSLIIKIIQRLQEKGRKILVLSDRIEQLERFFESLNEADFFIGGMSEFEREKARKSQVILGTYQYAKEGLDIPELDTLVLATPKSSIIQPAGRILRICEGKKQPLIVDIADNDINILKRFAMFRGHQYKSLGFKIKIKEGRFIW